MTTNEPTTEKRIAAVASWLLEGYRRSEIDAQAARLWSATPEEADQLAAQAELLLFRDAAAEAADVGDVAKARAILQLRTLYHKAEKIHDYKTALAARKELNKLAGLYPARGRKTPQLIHPGPPPALPQRPAAELLSILAGERIDR